VQKIGTVIVCGRTLILRKIYPFLLLATVLTSLAACHRAAPPTAIPTNTIAKTVIVVTATPSPTPIPPTSTVTPTPYLEEVRLTATPLPTLAPEEINVTVVQNEGPEITQHDRSFQHFIETQSQPHQVTQQDEMITFIYAGYCGDECGYKVTLVLRHVGVGQLPEFVAHTYKTSDYYSGQEQYQLAEGLLEIESWDLDGIVSGRVVREDDEHGWPPLAFWHDFSNQSLLSRHLQGEILSAEQLRLTLQGEDSAEKRDALTIISKQRVEQQEEMYLLVPDLIALIGDVTPIGSEFFYFGNEVTFTLSALASLNDGTYFAYREPLIDYTYYNEPQDSAETPPPPAQERIQALQANWQAVFDAFE